MHEISRLYFRILVFFAIRLRNDEAGGLGTPERRGRKAFCARDVSGN